MGRKLLDQGGPRPGENSLLPFLLCSSAETGKIKMPKTGPWGVCVLGGIHSSQAQRTFLQKLWLFSSVPHFLGRVPTSSYPTYLVGFLKATAAPLLDLGIGQ